MCPHCRALFLNSLLYAPGPQVPLLRQAAAIQGEILPPLWQRDIKYLREWEETWFPKQHRRTLLPGYSKIIGCGKVKRRPSLLNSIPLCGIGWQLGYSGLVQGIFPCSIKKGEAWLRPSCIYGPIGGAAVESSQGKITLYRGPLRLSSPAHLQVLLHMIMGDWGIA